VPGFDVPMPGSQMPVRQRVLFGISVWALVLSVCWLLLWTASLFVSAGAEHGLASILPYLVVGGIVAGSVLGVAAFLNVHRGRMPYALLGSATGIVVLQLTLISIA
jgi:hypothetical protein